MGELAQLSQVTLKGVPTLVGFEPKIILQEESKPYSTECQIEALHDLQAVSCWLKKYADSPKTFDAYRREAERLLMWCVYERGLSLGKLKVQDFEAYFQFLQAPPPAWCATRSNLRAGKYSGAWRPFIAGLNTTALEMAGRVIHSLMNYLVTADYLRANPLKLVNIIKSSSIDSEERKYQVWERMLEADEWQAVQQTLENLTESSVFEIENKVRTQLLFALLYFLGLRIHEVATHSWNAFRLKDEQWWFFVKGKGQQYAHIPVNHKLLMFVKVYRLHLGKLPLPSPDEEEPIFISKITKNPIAIRQLYNLVKRVGIEASKQFKKDPLKQKKMQRLSPHWLRHLFASHQDKAGVPATIIRANMRHASHQTTQIYLHAEDNLRHQEVQKVDMRVRHYTQRPKKQKPELRINVRLSEGSIGRLLSLEKLIESIEQNVLQGYRWYWEGVSKEIFLGKLQHEIIRSRVIDFNYRIEHLSEEQINILRTQVKLESEIRMFVCEVDIGAIK